MSPDIHPYLPGRPRVLGYPGRHPYIDRFDYAIANVVHPDVSPGERCDPKWLRSHDSDWDLVHVLLDDQPVNLTALTAALMAHRARSTPVVLTIQDTRSPAGAVEQNTLARSIQAVAAHADVVTATSTATATAVADITGHRPRVFVHGPVLPPPDLWSARRHRSACGGQWGPVLAFAEPWHPGYDLGSVLSATQMLGRSVPIRLVVPRPSVTDVGSQVPDQVEVVPHDGMQIADLVAHLAQARALVLPYRWGSNVSLMELATDVGTRVIATDASAVPDDLPISCVPVVGGRVDPIELAAAMSDLPDPSSVVRPEDRERSAHHVMAAHERLYNSVAASAPRSLSQRPASA